VSWSFKIGSYRGIGVYVHATFFLLLAFIATVHWTNTRDVMKVVEGLIFILSIFGCVVLHEFGHALMAARYGIKTKDITLLPIGGLARLEKMPENPWEELWVALAGPAVNVVIAVILAAILLLTASFQPLDEVTTTSGPFLERLLIVNIILVVFNMLPAFPMDGGRVLRAFLATQMPYTRATHLAASVGQAMALMFGLIGLFVNPFLIFIALFVWIGASQEASMVQMKSALGGIPVRVAMITQYNTLAPDDTLDDATGLILSGSQQDFPVVEDHHVVGILTRADLLTSLSSKDRSTKISEVMQHQFESVEPSDMLETAFERLQSCQCRTMPVVQQGDLIGILTMDNVGEFIAIRQALEGKQA
jgi:Zn-dependent protease/predicted transcriptional regulator